MGNFLMTMAAPVVSTTDTKFNLPNAGVYFLYSKNTNKFFIGLNPLGNDIEKLMDETEFKNEEIKSAWFDYNNQEIDTELRYKFVRGMFDPEVQMLEYGDNYITTLDYPCNNTSELEDYITKLAIENKEKCTNYQFLKEINEINLNKYLDSIRVVHEIIFHNIKTNIPHDILHIIYKHLMTGYDLEIVKLQGREEDLLLDDKDPEFLKYHEECYKLLESFD